MNELNLDDLLDLIEPPTQWQAKERQEGIWGQNSRLSFELTGIRSVASERVRLVFTQYCVQCNNSSSDYLTFRYKLRAEIINAGAEPILLGYKEVEDSRGNHKAWDSIHLAYKRLHYRLFDEERVRREQEKSNRVLVHLRRGKQD